MTTHPDSAPSLRELARHIDQTMLQPLAPDEVVRRYLASAGAGFACFVTHPFYLKRLAAQGRGRTPLAAVIDFPFGLASAREKVGCITRAMADGARELDLVVNLALAAAGNWKAVREELLLLERATRGTVRKVIIETAYRDRDSLRIMGEMIAGAGFEFVKTSTGYAPKGARVADVRLLSKAAGPSCGVKASGGIRTLSSCLRFLRAGAGRIGTSRGLEILREAKDTMNRGGKGRG